MLEFSLFLLGACCGYGVSLFVAGAFGVADRSHEWGNYNNKGAEDEQ
jgi:hypothetical protein